MASKARKPSKTKPKKQSGRATWKVFDRGAKIAAGALASQAAGLTWRAATGKRPPTSSAVRNPQMRTIEAVTWAALAGASVELAKVLVNRGAASYWLKSTGQLPPGMKSLTQARTEDAAERAKRR